MKLTNKKDGAIVPVMHGENLLELVEKLPKGEIIEAKNYIVGHSETGHHHVLEAKDNMQIVEGIDRYIKVNSVAKLFHQKSYDIHETIEVQPGIYKIHHKSEWNPFQKVLDKVFD
jgi:hypothetical protein